MWGRSAPRIFIYKSRNIGPICYMKIEALKLDNTCKCLTRRLGAFSVVFFSFLTFHGMFLNPAWTDDSSLPSLPPTCRTATAIPGKFMHPSLASQTIPCGQSLISKEDNRVFGWGPLKLPCKLQAPALENCPYTRRL